MSAAKPRPNVASGASAANAATSANTANTVVKRDGSGNFSAGTVTGIFSGDGAGVTNLNGANLVSGSVSAAQIAAGAVGNTQLAANAVQAGNIPAGAVGSNQPASAAAVANLNASGQSGVAGGGVILSSSPTSANLINAGYVKIGRTAIGEVWEAQTNGTPPAGRFEHTAVWTGSEMIVWGGKNGTSYFNDGSRYNPAANTWALTTITGAPSARRAHSAVWTGSEITVFNGGARFSPALAGWTALTTTGAPAGRSDHTAVWTGIAMIIWGGQAHASGDQYFDDTYSYQLPSTMYLYLKP